MVSDTVITVVVAAVMLAGLLGVFVPVLPGLFVTWAAAIAYGLLVGFGGVGVATVAVISILFASSVAVGVLLPKRAVDSAGASRRSQLAGVVGALIGFFTIPFVGGFVGAIAAVLISEYVEQESWARAWESTVALVKGFGLSALVQFGIGTLMVGTWSIWALTVVL
ncbi:MAG: DUF456 family protein [Acidimicrobiales bacterium]